MRVKIYILLLIVITAFKARSQSTVNNINSYIPPSPNASSTVNVLGSYSVDKYSGKLLYNASINSFSVGKVSIPLGVNYVSSGVKVQDMAGSVGLGWNLSGGGAITRYVAGLPDETINGYCGLNQIGAKNYSAQNLAYYQNMLSGAYDTQPDKFYFSFLGFSGVFMLDPNGNVVLQSSYGLKILYCPFNRTNGRTAGGAEDWVIVDQSGNKYYFGDGAIEENVTTSDGQHSANVSSYISTWYINKIVTVDGQTVSFNYLTGGAIHYNNYVNVLHNWVASNNTSQSNNYDENTQTFVTSPLYLKSITCSIFEIDFKYGLTRTDIPNALALTEIDALQNNYLQYIYKFHYSYFSSPNGTDTRLKLDGISQISTKAYGEHFLYSFNYNVGQGLPNRNSIQTDYLGFYNSNPGTSNIDGYLNCSKAPDFNRSMANILTSVINNTGGTVAFTYQQNTVSDGTQNLAKAGLRISKIAAELNTGETLAETYTYNDPSIGLSSGHEETITNYLSFGYDNYQSSELVSTNNGINGPQTTYSFVTVTKTDGSAIRYKFTDYNAYPDYNTITYFCSNANVDAPSTGPSSNAFVAFGDRAQTSYGFARGKVLSEEYLDNTSRVVKANTYQYTLSSKQGNIVGATALPDYFIQGQLTGYYRNTYNFFTQDLQLTSKTSLTNIYNGSSLQNSLTETENYTYSILYPNLVSSQTKLLSDGSSEKITYHYAFDVLNTTFGAYSTSAYPISFLVSNNIINQPLEIIKSKIKSGVETISSVSLTTHQQSVAGSVKPYMRYRLNNTQSLPQSSFQNYQVSNPNTGAPENQVIDSRMEPIEKYGYDNFGNLSSIVNAYSTANTGFHSFLYGYGGDYLKAEITNSGNNNYYFEGFEETFSNNNVVKGVAHTGDYYYANTNYAVNWNPPDNLSYLICYWYRNGGVWKYSGEINYTGNSSTSMTLTGGDAYDDIKIYPAGAVMSTSTYTPFVGMTSLTDPKGRYTTYKYDSFQRLSAIFDRNGNIIKAFNYQNTEPSPLFSNGAYTGTFGATGCGPGMVGVPVSVTVPANTVSSPYSQVDADQQAVVYGQNYANTNGGCMLKQNIYARIELSNYTFNSSSTDPNNYSSNTFADVYIKFYSDPSCQTPLVLASSAAFVVNVNSNQYYGYGGGFGSNLNGSYNVAAFSNSYYIGNIMIDNSSTYTDPQSGFGTLTDTYSVVYTLVSTIDYTAEPTKN